jgi:16S rRNA processing protein RimM
MKVAGARIHGRTLVAKFDGIDDRDGAAKLRGMEVAVPRSDFPAAATNEFYWADLIGLSVVNLEHQEFGRVARMLQTGANDVLVVEGERERLIPFIGDVIRSVDLAAGVISVAWDKEY